MTPESIASRIISQARGKVLTEAGARRAIEEGLKAYGDFRYKEGMKKTLEVAGEISHKRVRSVITNIMEML